MTDNNTESEVVCDLTGSHVLDPEGRVMLVFHSKNAIISDPLEMSIISAKDWDRKQSTQDGNDKPTMNKAITKAPSGATSKTQVRATPEARPQKQKYRLGSGDIKIQVSDRHLSLVSPYFQALLSGRFAEAERLRNNGQVEITLEDEPIHGAMVLLKVIHSNFKVPNMTPSLLMQIAYLVDKWDLSGPMSYWLSTWASAVQEHAPTTNRKLRKRNWMAMYSMLKLLDERDRMSSMLETVIDEVPYSGHLPIDILWENMLHRRLLVLEEIFKSIRGLIEKYFNFDSKKRICSCRYTNCDAMTLGCLLRGLRAQNLHPLPEAPFPGVRLAELEIKLKDIKIKPYCARNSSSAQFKPLKEILKKLKTYPTWLAEMDMNKE